MGRPRDTHPLETDQSILIHLYIFGMGSNNNLNSNNNLGSYWLRAGPFRWDQQPSSSEAFLLPV